MTRREAAGNFILSLGVGLVGVDGFLIAAMHPTIARELHLA
jgi:hypothetical protein